MRRVRVPYRVSVLAMVSPLLLAAHAPAAEEPTPARTMEVSMAGGRLSVNLRDIPLADVLRLIGQEARVKVNLDGQFLAPITGTFTGLPLESGIRRLTRGHSSSFAYEPPPDPGQAARLTEIWVIESKPATSGDPRARAARLASLDNLGRRTDDAGGCGAESPPRPGSRPGGPHAGSRQYSVVRGMLAPLPP